MPRCKTVRHVLSFDIAVVINKMMPWQLVIALCDTYVTLVIALIAPCAQSDSVLSDFRICARQCSSTNLSTCSWYLSATWTDTCQKHSGNSVRTRNASGPMPRLVLLRRKTSENYENLTGWKACSCDLSRLAGFWILSLSGAEKNYNYNIY